MGKPSSPSSASSSLSSSKQAQVSTLGVSMEHHKVKQQQQPPRLSGAYIRSLVKHLTTSVKSKDNEEYPRLPDSISSNEDIIHQESSPPPPPPQQPYKKQVRRRQHATKPYQERLLNMAEARREIVTALRFHRASKQRQASGENCSLEASATAASNTAAVVPSYYWHVPNDNINPPPLPTQTINFALPSQTLGLNLNLQDFKTLDTNLYRNPQSNYYSTSSSSSSSPSTSSSAAIPLAVEEVAGAEKVVTQTLTTSSVTSSSRGLHHVMDDEGITEEAVAATTSSITSSSEGLHCALDDEGMEEIKSLGEQHQLEWNDTVNMLTYAQWFTFLKTIETEQEGENEVNRINEFHPCMDNGEIEGVNAEWLA
ncbi:uncharacterized protein LOC143566936 [Bidens hawaiensis]|uniref:uncharacterized protein LOC143566936 n=1 Tax=Bidens hawaiensis TaxID=980011 RepID=UPI00404BA3C0